ncbi:MAG: transposase [Lentisphaeraceae bacterium]|nr:transposase [Lentisphaeraceae bacterium]
MMSMIRREKFKSHNEDICLHIYNHCIGAFSQECPLSEDRDKRQLASLLHHYLQKYNIKCLAYSIMPDHFHFCLIVKKDLLTYKQMTTAYEKFTSSKLDVSCEEERIKRLQQKSNNISEFMREFQRGFSMWYNKTRDHKRRGTLWEARFKCTKIVGRGAITTLLKYVELNPIRAGLAEYMEDYEFTSYGKWHKTGQHPFGSNMKNYFMPLVRDRLEGNLMADLKRYFDETYTTIIANEGGAKMKKLDKLLGRVKSNPHQTKSLLQKSRYWVDGVVITDKQHYLEEMRLLLGEERAERHFMTKCFDGEEKLYCLRHFTQ